MAKEILGTSKLRHKFQITVSKEVKERFGVKAGDNLVVYDDNGKLVVGKGTQT